MMSIFLLSQLMPIRVKTGNYCYVRNILDLIISCNRALSFSQIHLYLIGLIVANLFLPVPTISEACVTCIKLHFHSSIE